VKFAWPKHLENVQPEDAQKYTKEGD
jgi:hypothetical protein